MVAALCWGSPGRPQPSLPSRGCRQRGRCSRASPCRMRAAEMQSPSRRRPAPPPLPLAHVAAHGAPAAGWQQRAEPMRLLGGRGAGRGAPRARLALGRRARQLGPRHPAGAHGRGGGSGGGGGAGATISARRPVRSPRRRRSGTAEGGWEAGGRPGSLPPRPGVGGRPGSAPSPARRPRAPRAPHVGGRGP